MEPVKMESSDQSVSKAKDEAATSSKNSDVKNRGWPKGKKRYPKSPGAPKQPLSGYVHFLNDRRESVRKESPDMSFADISKTLANEWSQLSSEEKQKYAERAEHDKERYNREFQEYQLTDAYKEFMAQQGASSKKPNEDDKSKAPSSTKKSKKSKKKELAGGKKDDHNDSFNEDSISSSSLDIPIFREEFLELNRARETELRQLRKTVNEFEEQNAVLQKHVDNMKSAVSKLERDVAVTKENNESLEKQLEGLKALALKHLSHIQVPNYGSLTNDNVEEFTAKLFEAAQESPQIKEAVKKATANMDISALVAA